MHQTNLPAFIDPLKGRMALKSLDCQTSGIFQNSFGKNKLKKPKKPKPQANQQTKQKITNKQTKPQIKNICALPPPYNNIRSTEESLNKKCV